MRTGDCVVGEKGGDGGMGVGDGVVWGGGVCVGGGRAGGMVGMMKGGGGERWGGDGKCGMGCWWGVGWGSKDISVTSKASRIFSPALPPHEEKTGEFQTHDWKKKSMVKQRWGDRRVSALLKIGRALTLR